MNVEKDEPPNFEILAQNLNVRMVDRLPEKREYA